jgi:hypothetical protein
MRKVVTSVPAYMWTKSLPHAIYPASPRHMIIEGVGSREGEEEGDKRKPCTQQ